MELQDKMRIVQELVLGKQVTLIISGSVSSVESAFAAIRAYVIDKLGYTCCEITKT